MTWISAHCFRIGDKTLAVKDNRLPNTWEIFEIYREGKLVGKLKFYIRTSGVVGNPVFELVEIIDEDGVAVI